MQQLVRLKVLGTILFMTGCQAPFWGQPDRSISAVLTPNPVNVVIQDHEFAWDQIVDEVDNYFKIKKEERVRVDNGIISEGILTTYPKSGATMLEPWRLDSSPGFEKWQSTLQTIRRSATVRVVPAGATYTIQVEVLKEMEDLAKPENAVVSSIRNNVTTRISEDGTTESIPVGRQRWYPIGPDTDLEQRILKNILARLGG